MLLVPKVISVNVYRGVISVNRAIDVTLEQKIESFCLKNVHGAVVRAVCDTRVK
jgi:hypothetical protein